MATVWVMGARTVIAVHLPVVLAASTIGVWMFYVQHQFERTSWEYEEGSTHAEAALHGSSYYALPRLLMWLTCYVGVHHLHHLNSRIPYYRLKAALDSHPECEDVNRLTLVESLKCVRLTLWDEDERRLVTFKSARQNTV